MSKKSLFAGLFATILSLGAFSGAVLSRNNQVQENEAAMVTYTNGDGATYYDGISSTLTGDALLTALRSLNSTKRKSTVGYSAMGTTPFGKFKYTDYDPSTVQYDDNYQPYGTKLLSFYSGTPATSGMNREHVWPDSHGGNKVEADIHMPRPTLTAENGSRGNSFYVEGMKSTSAGWDPAMESFGDETYRGDSARIIFYCVVANSALSLIDENSHSTSKQNNDNLMGKLSDMLKWNLNYPVLQRERNRNEGAEYLQGNRNPFIDHPEYACKIWGNYNDATKAVCQGHMGDDDQPTIRAVGTFSKTTYNVGDELDPTGVTIIYNSGVQGEADVDVTSYVTWQPTKFEGSGEIEVYAKYQGLITSCGKVTVASQSYVTNPQVGVTYKLGFENTSVKSQLYIDGTAGSYSCNTTTNKSASADVTLEQASGGYYLKVTKQGGSATYLESYVDGEYVDLRFSSTPITVWQYESTHHTFTTEISGCTNTKKNGTNFIGSYGTYTDLRISSISYINSDTNYPAHLYAVDEVTPVDTRLEISGSLYTEEYYVGDEFDPAGLTVKYYVGDNATDVTYDVTWSLSTLTVAGEFEVTASYKGLKAKYEGKITVLHYEELQVSGSLVQTTYELNDYINLKGVTVTYVLDGDLFDVTNKVTWDPMHFTEVGEIYLSISYKSAYSTLVYGYGFVTVVEQGQSSSEQTSESSEEQYSESSEQQTSSEQISSEQTTSSNNSSSSSGEDLPSKGGCKASIGGSSSIVFITGLVGLFFAIRHLIKIKKEEK